jgi:alpha-beta hydrolase superfamily lysophospholipase
MPVLSLDESVSNEVQRCCPGRIPYDSRQLASGAPRRANMILTQNHIRILSSGGEIAGVLFLPESHSPVPALIVCHGAGEFKENHFPLCELLAADGIASLAIDMHGHGESTGDRFCVRMEEWVADIRAALDYLVSHPAIDRERLAGFGLSSGGTAILEAAVIDSRLKVLATLDATVRDSLPLFTGLFLKMLTAVGKFKKAITKRELRVSLLKLGGKSQLASDPEIAKRLTEDPRAKAAFGSFPFPGGSEAFFVDTIKRLPLIKAPTLVLWGEDDKIDPPESGRLLFEGLGGKKQLHIIPGNGHAGHLDRNKEKVFALTIDWLLKNLVGEVCGQMKPKIVEGAEAKALGQDEKWELLSPFLKQHGHQALSYSTLQAGMEYFINDLGYISYTTVQHPVFSPKPKKIAFADPVCAPADLPKLVRDFLVRNPRAVFSCISEPFAELLHDMRFKVNCLGAEMELPVQTYNTQGNWKELDLIKRARNEAKREGIVIREERIEHVNRDQLAAISSRWIGTKKVSDREIWIYARRAVFHFEECVRKFVAYDREGKVAGFVFYDPMFCDGRVVGYAATVSRCDEARFGRLSTAVHMHAMDQFKKEGVEVLSLHLSPFMKLENGKFNDDLGVKLFLKVSAKYGNEIYNFQGLSFHKAKYRGTDRNLYFASNSLWPSNDVYLAFLSADIARSYFETLGLLVKGMIRFYSPKPTSHKTVPDKAPIPNHSL